MGDRRIVCERARAWAALQPDGELSGFERRLLDAHLERCAPCSAFAARVVAATAALRETPLEPLRHPVTATGFHRLGSRRFAARRAAYSVGAAAAAAVMAFSITSGIPTRGDHAAVLAPLVVVAGGDDRNDVKAMRELRRLQLATDIAPPASSRATQFGATGL